MIGACISLPAEIKIWIIIIIIIFDFNVSTSERTSELFYT